MKLKKLYLYIVCIFSIVTYSFWECLLKNFNIHIFHPCNAIFIFLLLVYIVFKDIDYNNFSKSFFETENILVFLLISTFINCIKELFFNGTLFSLPQIVTILFIFALYHVIKIDKKL